MDNDIQPRIKAKRIESTTATIFFEFESERRHAQVASRESTHKNEYEVVIKSTNVATHYCTKTLQVIKSYEL